MRESILVLVVLFAFSSAYADTASTEAKIEKGEKALAGYREKLKSKKAKFATERDAAKKTLAAFRDSIDAVWKTVWKNEELKEVKNLLSELNLYKTTTEGELDKEAPSDAKESAIEKFTETREKIKTIAQKLDEANKDREEKDKFKLSLDGIKTARQTAYDSLTAISPLATISIKKYLETVEAQLEIAKDELEDAFVSASCDLASKLETIGKKTPDPDTKKKAKKIKEAFKESKLLGLFEEARDMHKKMHMNYAAKTLGEARNQLGAIREELAEKPGATESENAKAKLIELTERVEQAKSALEKQNEKHPESRDQEADIEDNDFLVVIDALGKTKEKIIGDGKEEQDMGIKIDAILTLLEEAKKSVNAKQLTAVVETIVAIAELKDDDDATATAKLKEVRDKTKEVADALTVTLTKLTTALGIADKHLQALERALAGVEESKKEKQEPENLAMTVAKEVLKGLKAQELKEGKNIAKIAVAAKNRKVALLVKRDGDKKGVAKKYPIPPRSKWLHRQSTGTSDKESFSVEIARPVGKEREGLSLGLFKVEDHLDDYYRVHMKSAEGEVNWLELKSVQVAFEDGAISDIHITGVLKYENITVQLNSKAPISVSTVPAIERFGKPGHNILNESQSGTNYHIDLADVISYTREVAHVSGRYFPENGVITLNLEKDAEPITIKEKGIITHFDSRLYTDLMGLQSDQPQGLVQAEVSYSYILNPEPGLLTPNWLDSRLPRWVWLNRITPSLSFLKIENKLRTFDLETDPSALAQFSVQPIEGSADKLKIHAGPQKSIDLESTEIDVKTAVGMSEELAQFFARLDQKEISGRQLTFTATAADVPATDVPTSVQIQATLSGEDPPLLENATLELVIEGDNADNLRHQMDRYFNNLTIEVKQKVKPEISALELVQYANSDFGVTANIFTYMGRSIRGGVDLRGGRLATNAATTKFARLAAGGIDTTRINRDIDALYHTYSGFIHYITNDQLDFGFSYGKTHIYMSETDVRLKGKSNVQTIQADISFHPDPQDRDRSVFARVKYLYDGKLSGSGPDRPWFVQVGYATPLTKFFGAPEPKKKKEAE